MEKYLIEGRRWFNKVNGNTYHTVTITNILPEGEALITQIPLTYGYGDQYIHTAYDWLVKNGHAKEEDRFNHELNRKRFIYTVADVGRKGDL